jgi:glycosyltransferase involved in cell wall biosynthesis
MLDLTIWMNYPAFYQGDLFRTLVASGEVDLKVVFAKLLTSDRVDLGWQNDLAGYTYHFLDESNKIADAVRVAWAGRRRLHIMNGLWAEPSFAAGLVTLAAAGSTYAIYSEASEPELPRSAAKRLSMAAFGKMLTPKAAGILSISRLAEDFFKRLGASQQAIYPFGYFRSHAQIADNLSLIKMGDKVEVIFVGQIIRRKGIDLLIEAIDPLFNRRPDLFLTIIGSGEMKPALVERVRSQGLSERIKFEDAISPVDIPARVGAAAVLVLPSRWDGWGVVVNEAFAVGVPVIVSDRCGAADLVESGVNGYVFRSEDVADLRACLDGFIENRSCWPRLRAAAALTGRMISTEQTAPYLINCLKHMVGALSERPAPPWEELGLVEDVAR